MGPVDHCKANPAGACTRRLWAPQLAPTRAPWQLAQLHVQYEIRRETLHPLLPWDPGGDFGVSETGGRPGPPAG